MYDVVIIGSGPAGLAATMYCIRKGMDVQLIPGHFGGKSTMGLTVPDMSEFHLIKAREQVQVFRGHVEYLTHTWRKGYVATIEDRGSHFDLTMTDKEQLQAERLIIATGVKVPPLEVPGVKEFLGKSLGTSAISYTHLLRERKVVILGNGDRAVEAAVEAAQQAEQVDLVLEPGSTHGKEHLALLRRQENAQVHLESTVVRFDGQAFAESITILEGVAAGGSAAAAGTVITADAFFLEHEPQPNSALVADLVERTPDGAIVINERNETSHRRIFAAGDVTTVGIEQILVALGEGARAALSAYRHLTLEPEG